MKCLCVNNLRRSWSHRVTGVSLGQHDCQQVNSDRISEGLLELAPLGRGAVIGRVIPRPFQCLTHAVDEALGDRSCLSMARNVHTHDNGKRKEVVYAVLHPTEDLLSRSLR